MGMHSDITPFEATHPGILIKDELDLREDINQKDLAKEMGVKASFLNEIIKGKRPITADFAIILEKILEIPANYWMKFQTQYEIDKARVKEKNIEKIKNIEIWDIIKEYVPIRYFKKHNYLSETIKEDIKSIMTIYGVSSIDGLVNSAAENRFAFYRKSEKLQIDEKNMLAWSSLATFEANNQVVNTFYEENIEQLCIQLNQVFFKNELTIENAKRILNQYGIKFVTVPKLEKTPVDGYSFWSNENPSIALTLRHNRIDNFAFTLMHEVGHVALHLSKNRETEFIDIYIEKSENIAEIEADEFAQKKLIPEKIWNEIIEKHLPINDVKIIRLGKEFGINPAILLGRVCYEINDYAYKTNIDKKMK
ncbi:HigA family addiction module antidote protein [Tenacibaculum finnmarkense]|uniref:HigA family addiction module antitoxin n=1 Tax=Tenacibaculum finnmarkense TaxID=2781243 RepID=UPI00187B4E12|nr:HigA family addiction module antitoxin [Tenacibaculum finnmarkense]MBE7635069.1 HigA family addiction module antidote protein [Tenacibaculum finnmarkense genomovar ulcerans]MCD8403804.1 HigA family addiction module antitoxin [Tenacibaculum finnmarkense genomovar finnmarkense]MCD8430975.1 HigA family addiction module antitoxin [Tenacibaculum finnmarkense genomovar ulcerans]MCD8433485.1 HigA family addiction module antitoxin [Tenacibaculum finnmarkense genomovar ulcerans]MCG8734642.1 HigA fam